MAIFLSRYGNDMSLAKVNADDGRKGDEPITGGFAIVYALLKPPPTVLPALLCRQARLCLLLAVPVLHYAISVA